MASAKAKAKTKAAKPAKIKKAGNAPDVAPAPAEPSDPKHRELRQTVFDNPASNEARLVYADWLMEHGDLHGEFIRLSIADPAYGTPEYKEITARLESLEKKHAKTWVAPIRRYVRSWAFDRWFPSFVVCDTGLFIEGAEALVATCPILCVEVTAVKPKQIPALAACPIGKLDELRISSQRLDDMQVKTLVSSPALTGLRKIDLGWNNFGAEGARAIASAPFAAKLRELTITNVAIGSEGLATILGSTSFKELEWLNAGQLGATTGLDAVTRGSFPMLRTLTLSQNAFGDAGAEAIAASTAFPAVERLSLGYCGITAKGALALARSTTLPASARHLDLQVLGGKLEISDADLAVVKARFPSLGL